MRRRVERDGTEPVAAQRGRRTIALSANTSWYLHNFRGNLIRDLLPEFRVLTLAPRDAYTARLEALGCVHRDVPFWQGGAHPVRDAWTVVCLGRVLLDERPELLLNFTPKAVTFGSLGAAVARVPVVNNISGLGRGFSSGGVGLVRGVASLLYRIAGRYARHTFFQNRRDLEFGLERGFAAAERSSLLPGSGVDLSRFTPAIEPLRDPVQFLYVSRLVREKGVLDFLEAGRLLRQEVDAGRFGLTVIGDDSWLGGADRSRFGEMVSELGAEYHGHVDDVRTHLRGKHCVVLPSSYAEGVPRSLIEAAATGKALICYPNPGCEAIVRDGVNGYVARPASVAALKDAMAAVLSLEPAEYRRMAEAGVTLAQSEFDERFVIEAYRRVIAANRDRRP